MKPDIEQIRELASEREEENWAFRERLKGSDTPFEEIDREARALYRRYSSEIDCTECGNCCKEMTPVLKGADIRRISGSLGLSVREVRERYLRYDEDGDITFHAKPCPFLSDNICTIYESRPDCCRSFPHLHEDGFLYRMDQALKNCPVCPIVFHVCEDLKEKFGHDSRSSGVSPL